MEHELERPFAFHDRTGHTLPPDRSKVQEQLKAIVDYANRNEMKVNKHKTKKNAIQLCKEKRLYP